MIDSLITDSAAGATAFACGIKTYNRGIGVDPRGRACGTVLEAAKRAGYVTGMVVTAKVTDATPACFASHVLYREYENAIAEQLIGNGPLNRTLDLLFGGTSLREDEVNRQVDDVIFYHGIILDHVELTIKISLLKPRRKDSSTSPIERSSIVSLLPTFPSSHSSLLAYTSPSTSSNRSTCPIL